MAKQSLDDWPTAEQVRELLRYDPETGQFRRRYNAGDGKHVGRTGEIVGTIAKASSKRNACLVISLGTTSPRRLAAGGFRKRAYKAHQLAWLITYGWWPLSEVDHINCDPTDNRLANLRLATTAESACNKLPRSDNKSGVKGVSWSKRSQKWLVHIGVNGKVLHLGLYETFEEAKAVRNEAARHMHGTFAREGARE